MAAERIRLSRHPASLILEGIRRKHDRTTLEKVLGNASTIIEVRDRERVSTIINASDLAPEERAALAAFDAQADLAHVARTTGVDVADVLPLAWGLVVLQQGPSSLEENRAQLRASTVTFADDIRKAGGRPALYMVWPSLVNAVTFDRTVESYRLAASDVEGVLFPVGEALRVARSRDESAPLYESDGYHPTLAGSYLAALVIVGRIHDRSPVGLPRRFAAGGREVNIPEALAVLLQGAAAEANARFPNP